LPLRRENRDSGTTPPKIYFKQQKPESIGTGRLSSRLVKSSPPPSNTGVPKAGMVAIQRPTEGMTMSIQTQVSEHALRQSQRRGISRETLDLVLTYHDRSRKLPGYARALWIGPRGRKALVQAGLPVAIIERCAGVRAIVDLADDLVLTVEHTCKRRRWV
jgi:hypothetical protein